MEFINFNDIIGQEICIVKNTNPFNICGERITSNWYAPINFLYYYRDKTTYYIDREIPIKLLSELRGSEFDYFSTNYATILIEGKPYITSFKRTIKELVDVTTRRLAGIEGIYMTPACRVREVLTMRINDYSATTVSGFATDIHYQYPNLTELRDEYTIDYPYFLDNSKLVKSLECRSHKIMERVVDKRLFNLVISPES